MTNWLPSCLRRIGVDRTGQRLRAAEFVGELSGRQVAVRFGRNLAADPGRSWCVQVPDHDRIDPLKHVVVRTKEPQLVLDDVATQVAAEVPLAIQVCNGRLISRPVDRGAVIGLQRAALIEAEERSGEVVAARLGDDVDDAAGHAAVLGVQAAGLHLDLLHEVEVELLDLLRALDARSSSALR